VRADLLMSLCKVCNPRESALFVLASDYELKANVKGDGWGVTPRSLNSLQEYNPSICRKTMFRLVQEDLVEPVGHGWRLKVKE
jgi:hypothetical protein